MVHKDFRDYSRQEINRNLEIKNTSDRIALKNVNRSTFDDINTDLRTKNYSFMMKPEQKVKLFEDDAKVKITKELSKIKKKELA